MAPQQALVDALQAWLLQRIKEKRGLVAGDVLGQPQGDGAQHLDRGRVHIDLARGFLSFGQVPEPVPVQIFLAQQAQPYGIAGDREGNFAILKEVHTVEQILVRKTADFMACCAIHGKDSQSSACK